MPKYTFDLASACLFDFDTYIVPTTGVPLKYRDRVLCEIDISERGIFECDLDETLIARLVNASAVIRELVEPDTNAVTERYLRILEITIFDIE